MGDPIFSLSTPVDSFFRNLRNDFSNRDKSTLCARDTNTMSGSASASLFIRISDVSLTKTGGFSTAFPPERLLEL
jgi:hypothetical protein